MSKQNPEGHNHDSLSDQITYRREGGDIPLPGNEIPATRVFTERARSELIKRGKLIYVLKGHSILSLKEAHKPFFSKWHSDSEEFESLTSSLTEVAFNPKALFLPDSRGKTIEEQFEMVNKFNEKLNIPDVEAVVGEAVDYIELAFQHFEQTEQRLFGNRYTVTQTQLGNQRILVGNFVMDGLVVDIGFLSERERKEKVFAVPLIVPSSK